MLENLEPFLEASNDLVPSCISISEKLGCTPIEFLHVFWLFTVASALLLGWTLGYIWAYVRTVIISWFRRLCARLFAHLQKHRKKKM